MTVQKFVYKNKKNEVKPYNLLVLSQTKTKMDGIDLNKLSIEDQKRVQEIQKQYETSMQEFYKKGYRIFNKENIVSRSE